MATFNRWKVLSMFLLMYVGVTLNGVGVRIDPRHFWPSRSKESVIKPAEIATNKSYKCEGFNQNDVVDVVEDTQNWCSFNSFREYFKKNHKFPDNGSWVDRHVGYGYTERYDLDFCKWKPLNVPECFLRKGVRRVFLTGDSNGFRLFLSMLNMTMYAGGHCEIIDHEHGPINLNGNASYFANRMGDPKLKDAFKMTPRGCKWCKAQSYLCQLITHKGVIKIELDFIETFLYNDGTLKVTKQAAEKYNLTESNTVLEFFFKNYFVKRGIPDVMFVVMPHNHEKWRKRPDTIKRFTDMMRYLSEAKPAQLPLMFIPTAGEYAAKKLTSSYNKKTFKGSTPLEFIYKINTDIYPLLEPYLLKPELNIHSFLNTANMSMGKVDWNDDGVHYIYIWYNMLIRSILSTFCA